MKQQSLGVRIYQNANILLQMFAEQSGDSQVLIGKINLQPKKVMLPPRLLIQFKGVYKIWNCNKKEDQNSTYSHFDISQTLNDLQFGTTKRQDQIKMVINSYEDLEREECFLEGAQKITQVNQQTEIQLNKAVSYPFVFNVPQKTPPSLAGIWFAGKRIQIKYMLIIKGKQIDTKNELFNAEFDIQISQSSIKTQPENKFCNIVQYRCFTRCFKCLGTYHVQLSATVLHPGQLQVEGRIFREGKKTQLIATEIDITLMGEIANVKKLTIGHKKMLLKVNEFEMLDGEVLIGYDPDLRSFESELITIRFWIQCKVQFLPHVWKMAKKQVTSEIEL